jgi:hypothetical protein
MMMRRALRVLFAAGAIAGFGSAVFGCREHRGERRAAFEAHVADVCTQAAARSARSEKTP